MMALLASIFFMANLTYFLWAVVAHIEIRWWIPAALSTFVTAELMAQFMEQLF